MKLFERFNCDECIHNTNGNGFRGCAYFGLNEDEINGVYQDEKRIGGKGTISNEDLRKKFGIHIPREGSTFSIDRYLKDYTHDGQCSEWSADYE